MNSQNWYIGFVVAYIFGFISYDVVLLKGQLLKSLIQNPQAWILPQRDLPTEIAIAFPETTKEQYAAASVVPRRTLEDELRESAGDLLKMRELKQNLDRRNKNVQ